MISSRWLKYWPYLFFGLIPLVFWTPFVDSYELPKVLVFLFLSFMGGGWLIGNIGRPKVFNKTAIILAIYLGYFILTSIVNNPVPTVILGNYYRYQGIMTWIGYGIFVAILTVIRFEETRLVGVIKFSSLLSATIVIAQGIGWWILKLPIYNYNGRMAGLFGNPIFAAGFLAISWVFWGFYRDNKRWINYAAWAMFLVAILMTASRSGLLVFLIMTLVPNLRLVNMKSIWLGVVLAIIGTVAVWQFSIRDQSSFDQRNMIWGKALIAFGQKPLFGWGLENFDNAFKSTLTNSDFDLKNIRVDKAHNELLENLVDGGIIGFCLYIGLIAMTMAGLWKKRQEKWSAVNLTLLISFMVLSSVNVVSVTEYLFFYLAVAAAISQKAFGRFPDSFQPE